VAVAVGDGSTAVAMAAEVHGSIADRRLYRTHLRGAGNQSVSRVPAMNRRIFCVILLPTSDCNVACDYCFERKEPHRFGDIVRIRPANHTWFVAVKLGELCG
jgi:hypothetical protein